MKLIPLASAGLLLTGWALCGFSCSPAQEAEASQIVAAACAVGGVASAVIATDGTIVAPNSTTAQNKIAEGQQLLTVNCAATQQGIAALAAAMASSPTALVAEEDRQAVKLKIPAATIRAAIHHYTGK
jgi:hypothetical protein